MKIVTILLFTVCSLICLKNQSILGCYEDKMLGIEICLNKHGIYNCKYPAVTYSNNGNYRLEHSGTWKIKGNKLILNSFEKSSINVQVEEYCTESKFIEFQFNPFMGIFNDTMMMGPTIIKLNGTEYRIPVNGKLLIKNKKFQSFIIADFETYYAEYYVKNQNSNLFKINMPDVSYATKYPYGSFFDFEKLTIKKNQLIFDRGFTLNKLD